MLSERHCIKNHLSKASVLSAEAIISCDALDFGCDGGRLDQTMEFLQDTSIPAVECNEERYAYLGKPLEKCPLFEEGLMEGAVECNLPRIKCTRNSKVKMTSKEEMQLEISTNGPITSKMLVFEDLAT